MKLSILHNVDALLQRSLIVVLLRTCDASPLDHCVRFSNSMFNSGLQDHHLQVQELKPAKQLLQSFQSF